jgi:hypothetical protein
MGGDGARLGKAKPTHMKKLPLILAAMAIYCANGTRISAQDNLTTAQWQREEKTDPLRGTHYSRFSLEGKFLTPPRNSANAHPLLVTHCLAGKNNFGHTGGKFLTGFIFVGGVVDSSVNEEGAVSVPIQFRLDDGKLQSENLSRSTDFSSIFFASPTCSLCGSGSDVFANILYGHHLPHKENTGSQIRKVVIGVSEYLGGEVVLQFDMPDASDVAETCGIIWHK